MTHLKTKGFTLIELMIVVAVIAVLAAIALPRFAQMMERSREGATKGDMAAMKSATEIYYGGWQGIWPTTLWSTASFSFSQNLDEIAVVRVTGAFVNNAPSPMGNNVTYTTKTAVPTGASNGWLYDSSNGIVYVNSTVVDSQNISYSYYGFQ